MTDAAFEERIARLDEWESRVLDAIDALEGVLLDPELSDYKPRREALMSALEWLEMEVTCGDCIGGRCHYGGETSQRSIAAAQAGVEFEDPTWGCLWLRSTCGKR